MLRSIVFLVLALVASVCGAKLRVIGGNFASSDEFPHMVSIRANGTHFCGGAIISKRHILTAAHCFYHYDDKLEEQYYYLITVVTGSNNILEGGNVHPIKDIKVHKTFINGIGARWVNDVAVIVLDSEITFSKTEQPIALPETHVIDNTTATITGWSTQKEDTSEDPIPILHSLDVKIMPHNICNPRLFEKRVDLRGHQLCGYSKEGSGICFYDSGSPLIQNKTVIGIASWIVHCAAGYPDIFTDVYKYLDFIKSAMM